MPSSMKSAIWDFSKMIHLRDNYATLTRRLNKRAMKIRQPINGSFELTERCNLECRMCYICQAANNRRKLDQELSAEQWVGIARMAVDNGMLFLLLTGGEVFLRPDFFDIYNPITRMGLILTLFTNGTLITETIAARLADAPPNRTEITLYGATRETYELITRIEGSYRQCINGIENLIKYNVPLGLKTTLTLYNMHELEAMRELAHSYNLPFTATWILTQRRDCRNDIFDIKDCRLPAADCIALEAADLASASEWIETANCGSVSAGDNNFYCSAGKSVFYINSKGEMTPCIDLISPGFSTIDGGFKKAWEQVQNFVDSAPPLSKTCLHCDERRFCPRCPAWSQIETGTLTEPVQYLCDIALTRKKYYEEYE